MQQPLNYPQAVDDVLALTHVPVIGINQDGLVTFLNDLFIDEYGWAAQELLEGPITTIIPPYMQQAHKIGFSRFLATEQPTLLGHNVKLDMLYKDGRISPTDHYIVGDRRSGSWRFAAIIKNL